MAPHKLMLDTIAARAAAATSGPWVANAGPSSGTVEVEQYNIADVWDLNNLAFIANARTDVPALVGALQAVLTLCETSEASPRALIRWHDGAPIVWCDEVRQAIAVALGPI